MKEEIASATQELVNELIATIYKTLLESSKYKYLKTIVLEYGMDGMVKLVGQIGKTSYETERYIFLCFHYKDDIVTELSEFLDTLKDEEREINITPTLFAIINKSDRYNAFIGQEKTVFYNSVVDLQYELERHGVSTFTIGCQTITSLELRSFANKWSDLLDEWNNKDKNK